MPGTPKWGILHTRFASGIRDAVSSPGVDGESAKVADRDTYLGYGWQKYVALFYNSYYNRLDFLQQALQSMVKIGPATITSAGKIGIAGLPSDYGYLLSIDKGDIDSISRETPEEFLKIKNGRYPSKTPTTSNQYCSPQADGILLLPGTLSVGTYDIVYIITPFDIRYSAIIGEDIPLDISHFDSILSFALYFWYTDLHEYEQAKAKLEEAYACAPYPLRRKVE